MSSTFVVTRRTVGQMRATLARIAQAAIQIVALYERYGPTSRGGSPTRLGGSARRATAHTTLVVQAAAACSHDYREEKRPAGAVRPTGTKR